MTIITICGSSGSFKTAEDLAGKRIVTSYEVLAGEYFSSIDDVAGLKEGEKTTIEYVSGSVEAACALGLADGIGKFPCMSLIYEIISVDTPYVPQWT